MNTMSGSPAAGKFVVIAEGSKHVWQNCVVQPVCTQIDPLGLQPVTTVLPESHACSCGYACSVIGFATLRSASRYTPARSTIVPPNGTAAIAWATVANGSP